MFDKFPNKKLYEFVCVVYDRGNESLSDREVVSKARANTLLEARRSVLTDSILSGGYFCRSMQLATVDGVPASFVE